MKTGEQQGKKIGRNIDKSTGVSDRLIREPSEPMVHSTSKSDDGLSSSTNTIHDDHHHSNTSSRLAMVVFFILLIMISIGVYMLFVNWPKITSSDPLDTRSASLAKALLTWYEQEVASDDHHHEDDHHGEETTVHTTTSTTNHHDDHEEEKFYWEETWPEPSDVDDDEDHDDHNGNGKDHGSGGDEVKHSAITSQDHQPSIQSEDEIKSNHEDAHSNDKNSLKKPTTVKSNGNQSNDLKSRVAGDNNNNDSDDDGDDGDDDVNNDSNDVKG